LVLVRGRGGIFISYRREETAPYAGRLYDHLSEHFGEDRVFMDVDSIAIGADFTKAIIDAVARCDILLVLIGRHWSAVTDVKGIRRIDYPHDFVRVEIEAALQREIRVVPVLVDGAVLPQANDLPPSLRPIVLRQALELSHAGFRSEVTRLIAAVNEVLNTVPGRTVKAPKAPSRSVVTQQGRWQLERLPGSFSRIALRLRSDVETHDITLQFGTLSESIIVDGKSEVIGVPFIHGAKEHPLRALSSTLGSDVTIRFQRGMLKIKSITLKVDNQILSLDYTSLF
jgi:hypothetical protein